MRKFATTSRKRGAGGSATLVAALVLVVTLSACTSSGGAIHQEAVSMPRGQSGSFLVDGDYSEGTFFGTDLSGDELPEIEPIVMNHTDEDFVAFMKQIASTLAAGSGEFCYIHHTATAWIQAPVHAVFPDSSEKAVAYLDALVAVNKHLAQVVGTTEERAAMNKFGDELVDLREPGALRLLFGGDTGTSATGSPGVGSSSDTVDGPLTDEQLAEQIGEIERVELLVAQVEQSVTQIQLVLNEADYRAHRDC